MKHFLSLVLVSLLAAPSFAENWPQFRGPLSNGSTHETGLPSNWSRTENIAWSADMLGPSAATPIVWNDCVFVSTTDLANNRLKALCLDAGSGELLWEHTVATDIRRDTRSTYAEPSPATDGRLVVFFYGNGELLAFNLDGEKKWQKNIGPFAFGWTFSSSPVLYNGRLYMQILQRDVAVGGRGNPTGNESYLLALDPQTGREQWRAIRPSKARAESLEAFTTPVVHAATGQLLVAGGDALTGHDLETGKELWRWGTWNPERIGHWRLVPSPVASEDVILACAPKRSPIYAVSAGGRGTLDDSALAWVSRDQRNISSDVPTPAYYDGDFFVLSDVRSSLSRVDPKSGQVRWTIRTPGREKYEASPTVADGKIYIVNFDGEVTVVRTDDGEVLQTVAMEPDLDNEHNVRSTIAIAGGRLFIRTNSKLYCVGGGRQPGS